jgi:N-acetylmuramoyl-L-alanine amidase
VKIRIAVLVCIIVFPAIILAADNIPLVDSTGRWLGNLPVLTRGDERLVPLNMLARIAQWDTGNQDGVLEVRLPENTVRVKAGNPFVVANGQLLQMRVPAGEWDGSLWLPLTNLKALFATRLQPDVRMANIRVILPPAPATPAAQIAADSTAVKWTLETVIVDAGHGGKDTGCKGLFNLKEKDITLDIARRLAVLLSNHNLQAELTREGDRFISLQDRTHFANGQKGDLFVSIHCNSSKDPSIRGSETYFLKPARSQKAVETALRENSVVQLEDSAHAYRDLTEENYILLTMATSRFMKDSEVWAANALKEFSKTAGMESRGMDQAGFYVLMGASMPAVLMECGYLTNSDDARILSSADGRQKMAEAMMNSILAMKAQLESASVR